MQHNGIFQNRLLARLTDADRLRLLPLLTLTSLPSRTLLVTPGKMIERCYFLESGVASVVLTTADGKQAEIGIIGREGMVDVVTAMGASTSPLEVFMQMPGDAYGVPTSEVVAMADESPTLRRLLLGFAHRFMIQISHSVLATVTLNIEDRLARWLLMNCDRLDSDSFSVTHEFMSLMLGVRRAGVTDALGSLAAAGHIATSRGQITILDRQGLEKRAGDSYAMPEANHDQLVGG